MSADSIEALVSMREPSGFDPRPVLGRLNTPALWLFGGHDLSIPVAKSQTVLDSLVRVASRPYTYTLYEQANHLLVLPDWPYDFPGNLRQDLITFIRTAIRDHRASR